jgi:hypothetical protein
VYCIFSNTSDFTAQLDVKKDQKAPLFFFNILQFLCKSL